MLTNCKQRFLADKNSFSTSGKEQFISVQIDQQRATGGGFPLSVKYVQVSTSTKKAKEQRQTSKREYYDFKRNERGLHYLNRV